VKARHDSDREATKLAELLLALKPGRQQARSARRDEA
jgi:hypothetical protein